MSNTTIDTSKYVFITAMLRARETNMVTREKLERMLAEPDFAGACRIAMECGYPDMSGMNIRGVEDTLSERRHNEFNDVEAVVPDKALVDLFRLKFDYHSAKALVKSDGQAKHLVTYDGRGEASTLVKYFMTKDMAMLPAPLAESIHESKTMLARTGNPCLADSILDHAYFQEMSATAAATGLPFAMDYVRLLIDASNLRTLIRSKMASKRLEVMSQNLMEGGSIPKSAVAESATAGNDVILQLFTAAGLGEAAEKGIQIHTGGGSMTEFEKAVDNAVNDFLSNAERIGFGPAAVISYLAAVENEVMSLRIVLTGKLMGIPADTLRERLRESYV